MLKETKEHRRYQLYLDKPYGNNLWSIRQTLGYSQRKLAEQCNLSMSKIARLERGDQPLTEKYIEIIENHTGFKVEIY